MMPGLRISNSPAASKIASPDRLRRHAPIEQLHRQITGLFVVAVRSATSISFVEEVSGCPRANPGESFPPAGDSAATVDPPWRRASMDCLHRGPTTRRPTTSRPAPNAATLCRSKRDNYSRQKSPCARCPENPARPIGRRSQKSPAPRPLAQSPRKPHPPLRHPILHRLDEGDLRLMRRRHGRLFHRAHRPIAFTHIARLRVLEIIDAPEDWQPAIRIRRRHAREMR